MKSAVSPGMISADPFRLYDCIRAIVWIVLLFIANGIVMRDIPIATRTGYICYGRRAASESYGVAPASEAPAAVSVGSSVSASFGCHIGYFP